MGHNVSLHGPLTSISFTSNCSKNVWNAPFVFRYNFRFSLTKRLKKVIVVFSKTLHLFFSIKSSNSVNITALNAHWSSVHEIFEKPGLRSSVVIQNLPSKLTGLSELCYQYISQEKFYKTWFIVLLPKNEQVLTNPNQSGKARWQTMWRIMLGVKTDSQENSKNMKVKRPIFLSCLWI